jgi:hypothetical protein
MCVRVRMQCWTRRPDRRLAHLRQVQVAHKLVQPFIGLLAFHSGLHTGWEEGKEAGRGWNEGRIGRLPRGLGRACMRPHLEATHVLTRDNVSGLRQALTDLQVGFAVQVGSLHVAHGLAKRPAAVGAGRRAQGGGGGEVAGARRRTFGSDEERRIMSAGK